MYFSNIRWQFGNYGYYKKVNIPIGILTPIKETAAGERSDGPGLDPGSRGPDDRLRHTYERLDNTDKMVQLDVSVSPEKCITKGVHRTGGT